MVPSDDGNSQNMLLLPDAILGGFTKPRKSRISETIRRQVKLLTALVCACAVPILATPGTRTLSARYHDRPTVTFPIGDHVNVLHDHKKTKP